MFLRSVCLLFSISFATGFLNNHYFAVMQSLGLRLRAVLTCKVYEKAIAVPHAVLNTSKSIGEIVGLVAIDINKISDAVHFVHITWTSVVSIVCT